MKHIFSIKVFSVKINKLGLEQQISQTMQWSGLFSFRSYIKALILKTKMACGLEWL